MRRNLAWAACRDRLVRLLDALVPRGGDGADIADSDANDPAERLDQAERLEPLARATAALSPRRRRVLDLQRGSATFAEAGAELGVSTLRCPRRPGPRATRSASSARRRCRT